jgi:beta-glucanase (GH16 family)
MDIMEQVNGRGTGGQDDSLQFGTLHYNQYGENDTQVNHQSTGGTIKQKAGHYWGDEFHLYQALWTPTSFTFLVDDLAYESIDLTSQVSYNSFTDSSNPFFFIVNLALGGDFPRRVPEEGFPARFELDWIRVWQQPDSGSQIKLNWADKAVIGHEGDEAQSRKGRDLSGVRNRLKQQQQEALTLIK